jgi:hypothetical protein
VWRDYLSTHPDPIYAAEVVRQNSEGWITNSNQQWTCAGDCEEYAATIEEIISGLKKIMRRVRQHFLWGPFPDLDSTPFPRAEIDVWPHFFKHEIDKIRMLINMSCKLRGMSLNEHISPKDKYVRYISVRNVIQRIVTCDLQSVWAVDALEAYCRVPIEDRMMRHLGIKICDHYFFYTCLVMGYAPSSRVYTAFGDALQWIVVHRDTSLFQAAAEGVVYDLLMHYVDGVFLVSVFFVVSHSTPFAFLQTTLAVTTMPPKRVSNSICCSRPGTNWESPPSRANACRPPQSSITSGFSS